MNKFIKKGGERIIINDKKPDNDMVTVRAIEVYEKENKMSITVNNVMFMSDLFNLFNLNISKEEYNNLMLEFGKNI